MHHLAKGSHGSLIRGTALTKRDTRNSADARTRPAICDSRPDDTVADDPKRGGVRIANRRPDPIVERSPLSNAFLET